MRSLLRAALLLPLVAGCATDADEPALDARDDCATCAGKADTWGAPEAGSCEAAAVVRVANEASFAELDDDARLNRRAVEHIVEARMEAPFETLTDVDDVPWVGPYTLGQLVDYTREQGGFEACAVIELGIVSDLDKTVIPPAGDLALPEAPYPGVAALYTILERGADGEGAPGDTTYVTARPDDRVEGVPEWLAAHGLPEGAIETGVSGLPWVARPEKVSDISRVFDAHPEQSFVLFGDSSHVDPEVYRDILDRYPGRVRAALIHQATATVSEDRLDGLYLHHGYPEAAAILAGLGVIDEADAWTVYEAAVDEGLALDEADFVALLEQHAAP